MNNTPHTIATQRVEIKAIVTHKRPHVDEIVAIVLLQSYGKKMFPGIEKAPIKFWDAGIGSLGTKTWKEYHKEGYILVGIGGGCFDEHPSSTKERSEDHCAATLVAKYLKIDHWPALEQILRYTKTNDTKGGNNPFDLAALITLGNKIWFDTDPQGILEWAMQPIKWWLKKQADFFTTTKKEFDTHARVFSCFYKGRKITIVSIKSDNPEIGAYARSKYGVEAQVVIQKNSKGQVSITSQKRASICFDRVVVALRKKEMQLKKIFYPKIDFASDGTIPQIPEWYYDKNAARIFNGSLSATEVPPTKIYFGDIVKMVQHGLSNQFSPQG